MRNDLTKRITIDAMFIAMILALSAVPYIGFIEIPGLATFTTIHVIVIVGAILFGWKEGGIFGATFGLFSFIVAWTSGTKLIDAACRNPLVSVLPRFLFGLFTGLVADRIRMVKKDSLRTGLYYALCGVMTFVHTVLFLLCLYFLSFNSEIFNQGFLTVATWIIGFGCLFEMGTAMLIAPAVCLACFKAFPKMTRSPYNFMKNNYKKLVKPYYEDCLADIKTFCGINSVYDETTVDEENPFGKGVTNALNWIKQKAENDGFKAVNYANKIVEITFGDGPKNLTIMAHCDVVPATGNWTGDPFVVRTQGKNIYGRGVSDDKGPLLASYYAIKALRDNNLLGGYQVRLLVGGNEESGSAGMIYYFEELKKPQPTYGFTPDADWPLIFAEKAICNFDVEGNIELPGLVSAKGGAATNAVIDEVVASFDDKDLFNFVKTNCLPNEVIDATTVKVLGKSAHGSMPELGDNAALKLLKGLASYYQKDQFTTMVNKLSSLDGAGLDIAFTSPSMGGCSLNLGLFSFENGFIKLTYNYRFVDGVDFEDVKARAIKACKPLNAVFGECSSLLYYPVDSPLITNLMAAYQEETGDMKSRPLAIGGGTYAKEASNVVAFGMQYPGEDTHMHEPDEVLNLDHLRESMAVYANAIVKLGDLIKHEN